MIELTCLIRLSDFRFRYFCTTILSLPWKYKYEARSQLAELLSTSNDIPTTAALTYFIGKIDYETEDRVEAEKNFLKVLKILESDKFDEKSSVCYIKSCNELAIIWAERDEASKVGFRFLGHLQIQCVLHTV